MNGRAEIVTTTTLAHNYWPGSLPQQTVQSRPYQYRSQYQEKLWRSRLFNDPGAPANVWADVPRGRLTPDHVVRLLHDVAAVCDMVGLAITEYTPWEVIATRNLLRKLPLLGS